MSPIYTMPALPDSTDSDLTDAPDSLTSKERREREELKAKLRARITFQKVRICSRLLACLPVPRPLVALYRDCDIRDLTRMHL